MVNLERDEGEQFAAKEKEAERVGNGVLDKKGGEGKRTGQLGHVIGKFFCVLLWYFVVSLVPNRFYQN